MPIKIVSTILVSLILAVQVNAATTRSSGAKADFKREHPCPATGARSGPCGGYVIDHVVPLACGGADATSNMQWQTIPEAKAKDRADCRRDADCAKELRCQNNQCQGRP
jgi:hypothetical protein